MSPGIETLIMHHAEERERFLGAAAPPIFQNSTFTYPDCESFARRGSVEAERYDYTRSGNPTTEMLERKVAALEGAEAAAAFASGMGAISAAVLSCVKSGDHLVTIETVYGPTRKLFSDYLPRFNIETTYVRGTEVEQFERAIRPNTRLLYLETPSSLLFELQDLSKIASLAKARGALTICDNSAATPCFQNPIRHGINLVVHTATKYIGGHSDLVAGLVAGAKGRIASILEHERQLLGGTCDPFCAWLMLRGLRTLPLRMERHQKNAREIARFLEGDARVARVFYPGLESHAQYGLGRKQTRGSGGLVSFQLREATREAAFAVVDALQWFGIAVSWGGHESLAIPLHTRDPATGEMVWIIRLSVGLETVVDLKADLYQALNHA